MLELRVPLLLLLMILSPGLYGGNGAGKKATYRTLPIRFEANQGQIPGTTQFLARGAGYVTLLSSGQATYMFRGAREPVTITAKLRRARRDAAFHAKGASTSTTNYLLGSDPKKWRSGIPNYARVTAAQIYPGIDWTYYGAGQQLEHDFLIAPGADPGQIVMEFTGPVPPRIDDYGDLVFDTPGENLRQKKPTAYQMAGDNRQEVAAKWAIYSDGSVGFTLGAYDATRPLVIDPAFVYGTYLGGDGRDTVADVAVDSTGAIYMTGITESANFPVQAAINPTFNRNRTAYVTKLAPAGNSIVYSTAAPCLFLCASIT